MKVSNFVKILNFGQKDYGKFRILVKISDFDENLEFLRKSGILAKVTAFAKILNFSENLEFRRKSRNFGENLEFSAKMSNFVKIF